MAEYQVLEDGGWIGNANALPEIEEMTLDDIVNALDNIDYPDTEELYNGGMLERIPNGIAVGFTQDVDGNTQDFQEICQFIYMNRVRVYIYDNGAFTLPEVRSVTNEELTELQANKFRRVILLSTDNWYGEGTPDKIIERVAI